jgi:DNA polymerase-3 subunit delta
LAGLGRGIEAIGLLRAVQGHLQRLHRVQADVARGRGLREAVQALRPPVFFRAVDAFSRQARCWRREALEASLAALLEAERACKRTGAPQAALAAAAVLSVARQGEAWRDGNPAPASGPGI